MQKKSNVLMVFAAMLLFGFVLSQNTLLTGDPLSAAPTMQDIFRDPSGITTIHFIHVGLGDSILIMNDSNAVLIDAGDADSGSTVVDYLYRQGISKLDALIATHPSDDHIGGMLAVLQAFPVNAFYCSDEAAETETYIQLMDSVSSHGLIPQFTDVGDIISFGDKSTSLTCLAPGANSADIFDSRNPCAWSLVYRLDAEGCSAVLTGDATLSVEQFMLQQNEAQLNCDILKIASHGSEASSSERFLQAACPAYAVICDGDEVKPNDKIYRYLQPLGTKILETARDGTIVFQLQDGKVSQVS